MGVTPARDFVSGARLKARFHVVDGKVEVFSTFHDAELDLDCAYDDSNGAHVGPGAASYCFPADIARHREGTGPYLDSFCTMAAAFAPSSGAATYALVEPRNACKTAPQVHLAKAPKTVEAFVRDDNGMCTAANSMSVQAFGGVVPIDTFVRAVEEIEPRAGRIGARVLVGSDGSRRVVGGFDRDRNEQAHVGVTDDGVARWVPVRVAFVGGGELLYADSTCTTSAASKIARTATCPLGSAVVLKGNCGVGSYFGLGSPVTSPFHRDGTNKCTVASAATLANLLAFDLGMPIPASAYEPVVTIDIGTDRVRRRGQGAGNDAPVAWGELIDAQTAEACDVVTTTDGSLRCAPSATAAVTFFADSGCNQTAIAIPVTGCEAGSTPRFVRESVPTSPRVFEVGTEIGEVYTQIEGKCVLFAPTVISRLFVVREINPTRFPPAILSGD